MWECRSEEKPAYFSSPPPLTTKKNFFQRRPKGTAPRLAKIFHFSTRPGQRDIGKQTTQHTHTRTKSPSLFFAVAGPPTSYNRKSRNRKRTDTPGENAEMWGRKNHGIPQTHILLYSES